MIKVQKYNFFKIMRSLAKVTFTVAVILIIFNLFVGLVCLLVFNPSTAPQLIPNLMRSLLSIGSVMLLTSGVFALIGNIKEIAIFIYNQFKCE